MDDRAVKALVRTLTARMRNNKKAKKELYLAARWLESYYPPSTTRLAWRNDFTPYLQVTTPKGYTMQLYRIQDVNSNLFYTDIDRCLWAVKFFDPSSTQWLAFNTVRDAAIFMDNYTLGEPIK